MSPAATLVDTLPDMAQQTLGWQAKRDLMMICAMTRGIGKAAAALSKGMKRKAVERVNASCDQRTLCQRTAVIVAPTRG